MQMEYIPLQDFLMMYIMPRNNLHSWMIGQMPSHSLHPVLFQLHIHQLYKCNQIVWLQQIDSQEQLTCHSIILKYIKNISNKLAINGKLSITNNVFGINTSIGISFVSANCSVCVNNVYYIDAFVQLTETVPENGTLFYVVKNDNVITFNRRLDAILINVLNGKIYQIMLLKDSNIFIANGTSIPSGFYKVTMIISIQQLLYTKWYCNVD